MDQIIELTVQEHYKSLVCWAIVKKSFEIIFFYLWEQLSGSVCYMKVEETTC